MAGSVRLETRHYQPALRASAVDQLLGGEARASTQVREMALRGSGPDTHELRGVSDGSAGDNVSSEDVDLAARWRRWGRASQVAVPHPARLTPDSPGCA